MRGSKSFNEPRVIEHTMHSVRIDELHDTLSNSTLLAPPDESCVPFAS
jgi:hypothetical protein